MQFGDKMIQTNRKSKYKKYHEINITHNHRRNLNEFEKFHSNGNQIPTLNTRRYTVKFADDVEAEYSANIIPDNMW